MTDFPLDINETLELTTLDETPEENSAVFQPAVGPSKSRRRSTLSGATISFRLRLSKAQLNTLDDFWRTDLKDGTLPFNMLHPRLETTATFRFESPPKYKPVSQDHWTADVELRRVA